MEPVFDNTDENENLLFDYLEGNLPAEQVKELEEKLLTDPSLQSELALWREAFIEPELYDTKNLEEKLLIAEPVIVLKGAAFQSIIVILLTSLFSLLPVRLDIKNPAGNAMYKIPAFSQAKNSQAGNTLIKQYIDNKQAANKEIHAVQPLRKAAVAEQILFEPLPALQVVALPERKPDAVSLLPSREIKIQMKKNASVRALSLKERRKIARMKEKALQRRTANEFLKGRVPYVVPLNTTNF